jgi:hypothetical protein
MSLEYFDNEGLPYALENTAGSSFFMRGNSKSDWAELDSWVTAKIRMNGSPITEAQALDMASELSVPN